MKLLRVFVMLCLLSFAEGYQAASSGPFGSSHQTESASPTPDSRETESACAKLKAVKLAHVTITIAAAVPAGPFTIPIKGANPPSIDLPAFCRVQGVLKPTSDSEINFEVWMPLSAWNGKFEQLGNGGFAGHIAYGSMATELQLGYATASTDDGHEGSVLDASWAVGHPEKVVDYGYRAVHETSGSAKEFIREFYGTKPSYSYFNGCSNGGREALMEAQRFPKDFNGIIAGAPANFFTHLMAGFLWNEQALRATPESFIPAEKLRAVQLKALAACHAQDGVNYGFLEDPRICHFDPLVLQCKNENRPDCLTEPQLETVRKIYAGPHDPGTGKLIFPGYGPGTDPGTWPAWMIGETPGSSVQAILGKQFFGYIVFEDPRWNISSFNLVADTRAADSKLGPIIDSVNPDLRKFKAQGGKLIQYQGWADPAISPLNGVHYYESVVEKMGRLEQTQDFYRLFMVPGMEHCAGGPGPNTIRRGPHPDSLPADPQDDVLNVLVQWVEHGVAPQEIVAA